jgi:hypothetical protein
MASVLAGQVQVVGGTWRNLRAGILGVFLAAWLFRRLERGRIARLRDIP